MSTSKRHSKTRTARRQADTLPHGLRPLIPGLAICSDSAAVAATVKAMGNYAPLLECARAHPETSAAIDWQDEHGEHFILCWARHDGPRFAHFLVTDERRTFLGLLIEYTRQAGMGLH